MSLPGTHVSERAAGLEHPRRGALGAGGSFHLASPGQSRAELGVPGRRGVGSRDGGQEKGLHGAVGGVP